MFPGGHSDEILKRHQSRLDLYAGKKDGSEGLVAGEACFNMKALIISQSQANR